MPAETRTCLRFEPGVRPEPETAIAWAVVEAKRYLKRRPVPSEVFDRCLQAARIAAWEKCESFDPSRGLLFSSYARPRVIGAIKDEMRASVCHGMGDYRQVRLRRPVAVVSLATLVEYQDAEDVTIADQLEADTHDPEAHLDWLREVCHVLPPRHATVMQLLYGHAAFRTMKATGRAMRLTEGRISQIHQEAVAMLRDHYRSWEEVA